MSFKLGNTVRLKGGRGPVMVVRKPGRLTVGGVATGRVQPGKVFCEWYNEQAGKYQSRFFDQEELELYKEPKEEQKRDTGYK